MRLPVNQPGSLGLIAIILAGVAAGAVAAPLLARDPAPVMAPTGPAADYPMVLGAPFTVDGVSYTPADTMNYDQVGYADIEAAGEGGAGPGVSLAHRTLPLPSYVEVTSLATGRTILVRVERRGPMTGRDLVALSPAAAAQLGASGRTPVRVRRVNPPEVERALLRTGQTAPARMDTPMSLVGVLLRKLDPSLGPPSTPAPTAAPSGSATPVPAPVTPVIKPAPVPARKAPAASAKQPIPPVKPHAAVSAPVPAPAPKKQASAPSASHPAPGVAHTGAVYVQVGAFSTRANAETAARQVGGTVAPAGKLFRVRIAGFAAKADAAAALAKARSAGYSDARIQRAD